MVKTINKKKIKMKNLEGLLFLTLCSLDVNCMGYCY